MPSYLDLGVLGVVVGSALLSMMRGFTREVLAIGSWAAAAVAAYYFYPRVVPYLEPYIHKAAVAQAVAAAIVFFATLIVVSLFTVRISDWILDSKIGALDRSLGAVFGAIRGFLLAVVAFSIYHWLVGDKQAPEWERTAKTRPALIDTANRIIALLPEDAAATVETWIKSKSPTPAANDAPPDKSATPTTNATPTPAATPAKKTEITPPSPSPSADKSRLDALINKLPLPPPAAAPAFPSPSPSSAKPKG